ncbi:MAG: hypothetical protein ACRCUT_11570 [Spirochaetota bacterium]
MRKIIYCAALTLCALCISELPSPAAVYEASSLHNAVGRSETVQDLFFERWETILERQLYVDVYGKINWLNDFKVNTVNGATGKTESVPMTLVRSYGSLTVDIPVWGGYDKEEVKARVDKGTSTKEKKEKKEKKKADTKEIEEDAGGLVQPKNFQVAFTTTGFHYGLTRKTSIDRGTAGNETATDYKFTQFFDDIFALSLLYTPYVYVHGGVIVNNQIDPNDDGTMSYSESRDGYPDFRWFFASNLLSFLNMNATVTGSQFEKVSAGTDLVALAELLVKVPAYTPRVTVTYKQVMMYNDDAWDAVWVNSAFIDGTALKTMNMSDGDKEHAKLHTVSLLITENIKNTFFADFFAEFQHCADTLISKRTGKELDLAKVREIRGSAGINFLAFSKGRTDVAKLSLGLGRYWDPGIAIHRTRGQGYDLFGGFCSLAYERPIAGAEFNINYNYSKELRKLIEAADKLALEGSVFFRF